MTLHRRIIAALLAIAAVAAPAQQRVLPQLAIDRAGAARQLTVRDVATSAQVAVGQVQTSVLSGTEFVAAGSRRDPDRSVLATIVAAPAGGDYGYSVFPADNGAGGDTFNTLMTSGLNTAAMPAIRRSTVVGSLNLQNAISVNRADVFGNGAARWSRYLERSTIIGTLACQWCGDDPAQLAAHHHDMFDPIVNGALRPGVAGWDWDSLETLSPGIGAKIAATTGATSSADVLGIVAVGRDAFNEAIRATDPSVAIGYKAGQDGYVLGGGVFVGPYAGRHAVFDTRSTMLGYSACVNAVEVSRLNCVGAFAGQDLVAGVDDDFLTPYAGATSTGAWRSVSRVMMLGRNAGEGIAPYDGAFLIHNSTAPRPLVQGNQLTGSLYFQWKAVCGSGVAATLAGTAAETTLASCQLPARAMGPNGLLKVTANWTHTSNANAKTLRVRVGGLGGDAISSVAGASQARSLIVAQVQNRGSEMVQIGLTNPGNAGAAGQSTSAPSAFAIDTSATRTIVITGQLATASDTATLESYVVEAMYLP